MSQVIVQVENLNLAYKSLRAVQNVSFSVKPGEIVAVIGQNGFGKTSVVECVEGLRKPDSGLCGCRSYFIQKERLDVKTEGKTGCKSGGPRAQCR